MNTLDHQLSALKDALAAETPPTATDRAVAAAIAAARRAPRCSSPPAADRWFVWPLALAAAIGALSFIVRQAPPDVVPEASAAPSASFMPVVPREELARTGDAYVMPARMPRMALAQFGLPVNPARAAEPIDAELLVRPDGAVLAVRFVN